MENERRWLLFIGISISVLFLWSEFMVPKPAPRSATKAPAPVAATTPTSPAETPAHPTSATEVARSSERMPPISVPATTAVLETELWKGIWSNQGAALTEFDLKKYLQQPKKGAPGVTIHPFRGPAPSPLQWRFDVNGQKISDRQIPYMEKGKEPASLRYEGQASADLTASKEYDPQPSSYLVTHVLKLENHGKQSLKIQPEIMVSTSLEGVKKPSAFHPGDPVHLAAYINEKSFRKTPEDLLKSKEVPPGEIQWGGIESHYFLMALRPLEGRWSALRLETLESEVEPGKKKVDQVSMVFVYPPVDLAPGASQVLKLEAFLGPKDIGILKTAGGNLDRAIDLGDWLGPIARPILYFLRWLHSLIPNYGIAIILLTVCVRLLLFPLAQMQAKSARRMQEHKPQMDALKEKYAKDKEAYSRELMAYMKRYKINPAGGCLPMLPQLPIFFALYRVLYNSIELRHAPFFGWIHDLSAHDPFFVMPALLGITMFMQQRITPMPGVDPAQQKMMKLMPIMFTGFMIFLPAGLNLYIFVSTLWGVAQQLWVQRANTSVMAPKKKALENS